MISFFRALFGGISLTIAYCIVILVSPIILLIMGYTDYYSKPKLFGLPLYSIRTHDTTFESEATALGLILSLLLGVVLYLFVTRVARSISRNSR